MSPQVEIAGRETGAVRRVAPRGKGGASSVSNCMSASVLTDDTEKEKESTQTHWLNKAQVLIEFSTQVRADEEEEEEEGGEEEPKEGLRDESTGAVEEWGWSLVIAAECVPYMKQQETISLEENSAPQTVLVAERDRCLEQLQSAHGDKTVVGDVLHTDTDTDTDLIPSCEEPCSEVHIVTLFAAFCEALSSHAETAHTQQSSTRKKKTIVMKNRYFPYQRRVCVSDVVAKGEGMKVSVPLNTFEYSYLADILESVTRKGRLLSTNRVSMACADSLSLHIEALSNTYTPSDSSEPDFVSVLRAVSAESGWGNDAATGSQREDLSLESPSTVAPSEMQLKQLQEMTFHVLHLRYYNKEGGMSLTV